MKGIAYTTTGNKYRRDWLTGEMLDFVWKAKNRTDAIHNLNAIMREYEKRKRRVKLSYMIGANSLAHGSSAILALIFYQDTLKNFVYDTDENGNAILTQKGSFDKDGLLYTGRGLELGATNDLPIDTSGCASLVYHDGTNYVVVQSPSNPYIMIILYILV